MASEKHATCMHHITDLNVSPPLAWLPDVDIPKHHPASSERQHCTMHFPQERGIHYFRTHRCTELCFQTTADMASSRISLWAQCLLFLNKRFSLMQQFWQVLFRSFSPISLFDLPVPSPTDFLFLMKYEVSKYLPFMTVSTNWPHILLKFNL